MYCVYQLSILIFEVVIIVRKTGRGYCIFSPQQTKRIKITNMWEISRKALNTDLYQCSKINNVCEE